MWWPSSSSNDDVDDTEWIRFLHSIGDEVLGPGKEKLKEEKIFCKIKLTVPFLNPITSFIPPRIILGKISSGSREILISWTPPAVIISGWCIAIFAFIITTFTSRWIPWKKKSLFALHYFVNLLGLPVWRSVISRLSSSMSWRIRRRISAFVVFVRTACVSGTAIRSIGWGRWNIPMIIATPKKRRI